MNITLPKNTLTAKDLKEYLGIDKVELYFKLGSEIRILRRNYRFTHKTDTKTRKVISSRIAEKNKELKKLTKFIISDFVEQGKSDTIRNGRRIYLSLILKEEVIRR